MNSVEKYLQHMQSIRSSGNATDETSYYTPLNNLLDEIGKEVKPRIRCILTLKNRGAGHPDGGLFSPEQFQKVTRGEPLPGQKPTRGAIEIKPTDDDTWATSDSDQVTKYWKEYGQVLVTNYWDFVHLTRDRDGKPAKLDRFRLTPNEKAFWKLAEHPGTIRAEFADRLVEFLKRVMLSTAAITAPKDLASYLASLARDAKLRVDEQRDLPALAHLRSALEQALGLKFEKEKGEHFFRSTLIQTLFYGVFSAWVLWNKEQPRTDKERFDWRKAEWSLHVPMIRVLYEEVSRPSRLGPLGLIEVLDLAEGALNRVERKEFFTRFQEQQAVQYFYEPFLEAFDPDLRKDLGVWYTPVEIVRYMVARTDRILREELKLEDGFADPQVYVLDAACGTGAYLVEILQTIAKTLKDKNDDPLAAAQEVKKFATQRVFGFEVLPAPFVISHLQLGLLLKELGAPLADNSDERVGVYLTNSLTGWEPPKGAKLKLAFPEMEKERDSADKVKREAPILVVIGNPPYNAFAGVSPAEEEGLVEPYKGLYKTDKVNKDGKTLKDKHGQPKKVEKYRLSDPEEEGGWDIRKFNLDDLYVRFFRLAERRLTERPTPGVICYISNFSYLSDPSYAIMRERLLEGFESIWIDCLNGDSRETGKTTPEGDPDPSVFSTDSNPEGIQLGTAIGLMVKREKRAHPTVVRYREFWGNNKRNNLLDSLQSKNIDADYQKTKPSRANRLSLRPTSVVPEYDSWPRPKDFCAEAPISGLQEMRSEALIDIDREPVEEIARAYFDPKVKWDKLDAFGTSLTKDISGFDARAVRAKLQEAEKFTEERIMRYALYPLDSRWCYWTATNPLWNRPRPALVEQKWDGNRFFIVRMFAERAREHAPLLITSLLPDYHLLRPNAVAIPFRLKFKEPEDDLHHGRIKAREDIPTAPVANLSVQARKYLTFLGLTNPDDEHEASLIWLHAMAIGYSPLYLKENNCGIRYNWPRFPMPAHKEAFLKSADLGNSITQLLNSEVGVKGVTTGTLRPEIKVLGNLTLVTDKQLDPAKHLKIDVGWGHEGKEGITMGGKGVLIERPYSDAEQKAIQEGASAFGLSLEQALVQLGEKTSDVYLNDGAYWKNVPSRAWDFTIGGYQVLKKWLSYRETKLLGRVITPDEAYYFRDMVRRIAALCLLEPMLDANYIATKRNTYAWPGPIIVNTSPVAEFASVSKEG